MSQTLHSLYRFCFKQLYSLKKLDPIISHHYCATIKQMRYSKQLKYEKDQANFLDAFGKFLHKVNSGENKSCVKLVRIYSNTSEFCDSGLNLNISFESKALRNLNSDLQYLDLSVMDQQFVRKVIQKVCDKKKKLRYSNIAIFLNSHNSQNFQTKITPNKVNPDILNHFQNGNTCLQPYFQEMIVREEDKMRKVLQELYSNGIVLI